MPSAMRAFSPVVAEELREDLSNHQYGALADMLDVPNERIVSIEHPCILRSLENGLKSLGGEAQLMHVIDHRVGDSLENPQQPKPEPEVGLSFRPEDPLAKKISSTGVETRNILVKVTVPKRTGRKRKRGRGEPFEHYDEPKSVSSITAPELLKRLRDNESRYVIEPVGTVHETHRFRGLPDFQSRAGDQPIFQELNAHVLQPKWSSLKDFHLDETPGVPVMSSFPGPPYYAASAQPYRYEYQQAAGVRFSQKEDGTISSVNLQAPPRKLVKPVLSDVKEVPQAAPAGLQWHNANSALLPRLVASLEQLLDDRPLVTRRVSLNRMPGCTESIFREVIQWVGYSFNAGPFRDTLIKYGIDPRSDPQYRHYQTIMFQLDKKHLPALVDEGNKKWTRTSKAQPGDEIAQNSHIFDGEQVSTNGKTWQLCDLHDPILRQILDTAVVQPVCDPYIYGWYSSTTISKVRFIMRHKMDKLLERQPIPHDLYALLATLPENLEDFNAERAMAFFGDVPLAREAGAHASEIRSMAKAVHKFRRTASQQDAADRLEEESIVGDLEEDIDEEDDAEA